MLRMDMERDVHRLAPRVRKGVFRLSILNPRVMQSSGFAKSQTTHKHMYYTGPTGRSDDAGRSRKEPAIEVGDERSYDGREDSHTHVSASAQAQNNEADPPRSMRPPLSSLRNAVMAAHQFHSSPYCASV